MKKIVYKVFEYEKKQKVPVYEIFDDGSVNIPITDHVLYKHRTSFNESVNSLIEFKRKNMFEAFCEYFNDQYIATNENMEAFVTLCILLDEAPPFKGYRIKYYGEGEPWIPNPDYVPNAKI